jgi:HTH-type transcriptional regulator, sugar sensing transcriptional regulator
MQLESLEEIGLTKGEIKVYLALCKLGCSKTGKLAKEASVSSSKVYKILDRLEKKGFVGHIIKGKVKYFNSTSPKRILDYVDEKQEILARKKEIIRDIIPEIELAQKLSGNKTEATIYEGFKSIKNFFNNIIDELNPGETYHVIGAKYVDVLGSRPFFKDYHNRRAKKGIKVKMLANNEIRNTIVPETSVLSEIKFLPDYLITNMSLVFYRHKVFIVIWTSETIGFLLESAEAVESFESYFKAFWKIAKP